MFLPRADIGTQIRCGTWQLIQSHTNLSSLFLRNTWLGIKKIIIITLLIDSPNRINLKCTSKELSKFLSQMRSVGTVLLYIGGECHRILTNINSLSLPTVITTRPSSWLWWESHFLATNILTDSEVGKSHWNNFGSKRTSYRGPYKWCSIELSSGKMEGCGNMYKWPDINKQRCNQTISHTQRTNVTPTETKCRFSDPLSSWRKSSLLPAALPLNPNTPQGGRRQHFFTHH